MRIFLNIQYDGTNYNGWQIQPNVITIQEKIEDVLSKIYSSHIDITGCGRTDSGVHASDYYLHYDTDIQLNMQYKQLVYHLNCMLPDDIKIVKALIPINEDINARFSAKSRTYRYTIITEKQPFICRYAYRYRANIDLDIMNKSCEILKTYNDFTSFAKTGTHVATNNCTIYEAQWRKDGGTINFTITANRFLRNMVRAITGTMLNVGKHKITLDDFEQIIKGKKRSFAGDSVPAQGLCLIKVDYGDLLRTID